MKLLAVDTSTGSCGVALFADHQLLCETVYTAGRSHSRCLLSIIHRTLSDCGCDPEDLDVIAVARGPGTFTGLRIGLSTVKGLALATRSAVVGVSSLTALAFPLALVDRPVAAMIDARRGEVYHALYHTGSNMIEMDSPATVCSPERAASTLPAQAVLVGSGALLYRAVFESRCPGIRLVDPAQHVIRAASVGLLAMARYQRGEVDEVAALDPEYIRPSDAQSNY